MSYRPHLLSALMISTSLLVSACSVAPPMNAQEAQIKSDLSTDKYLPATRQMRDAIETQELFAQAAFWSNEYHLNPGDLESAIKLASAVRRLGNPGRAVEITQTTRALYPRDPYLVAEYAAALIASERSQEAIPILNDGLAITPAYGRLWSLKGAALDQQEKYFEARQNYDRALRITPNDPNVMANIGLSYALSGDVATAEGWLRRAAANPNASASVKQNLGLVLQLQGKTEEANSFTRQTRTAAALPQIRPAFNPAPIAQNIAPQQSAASIQSGVPRARLQTGLSEGQSFKSASDAARAMAANRSQQQPLQQQTPAQYPNVPPQNYTPQAYPQPGNNFAVPPQAQQQPIAPERRAANRRRR